MLNVPAGHFSWLFRSNGVPRYPAAGHKQDDIPDVGVKDPEGHKVHLSSCQLTSCDVIGAFVPYLPGGQTICPRFVDRTDPCNFSHLFCCEQKKNLSQSSCDEHDSTFLALIITKHKLIAKEFMFIRVTKRLKEELVA